MQRQLSDHASQDQNQNVDRSPYHLLKTCPCHLCF